MSEQRSEAKQRYEIFTVKEPAREGDKAFWTRIGTAFTNRDGESFSIILDALPVNGKLQMRKPQERREGHDQHRGSRNDF